MTSKISYNIHAQGIKDQEKLLAHLRIIKPKAVVVMDGLGLARIIKSQNPDTIVIFREWPDDDIYRRMTPAQWLSQKRATVGSDDIWCYTTNEPGYDPTIIAWHEELIKQNFASLNPLKLVIMNISSGVPKPEEWNQADNLLRLAAKYRDRVIIGLHEYFGGVPTSGFIGGNPDDIRYHPNYIVRNNWPAKEAAKDLTKWHCGRFKFLVDYCNKNGIPIPRMILTEHGPDAMGDIDGWLKSLKVTPPYNSARGYKSLFNQWKSWYAEWSGPQTYFEMLKYLDQSVYSDSPVEAQLIFCSGHTAGAQWEQFDIEGDVEFMSLLEKYATIPANPVVIPPTPEVTLPVFPTDFAVRAVVVTISPKSSGAINVRSTPSVSGSIVSSITSPGPVNASCIPVDKLNITERISETIGGVSGTWVPVMVSNTPGWVFNALVIINNVTPPVVVPPPVVTPPVVTPPVVIPPTPEPIPISNIDGLLKTVESSILEAQAQLDSITDTIQKIRAALK